jgi:PKD repeat protein
MHKSILLSIAAILISVLSFAQAVIVNQVTAPSNALNCTATIITVAGYNAGSGFTLATPTYTITNDTILVNIGYTIPSFYITVITSWSHNISLGNVPYGSYTIIARAYGNGSLLSVEYGSLNVGACCPQAIPLFEFVEDTVCADANISVNNNSNGNNLSYLWEYDSISSTLANPTFSIIEAGTYDVTLTVTGDSCSDSLVKQIEVLELPYADLGNDTNICDGDTLVLALAAGNDYLWSDGSTSYQNSIATISSLSVTVTDDNGCEGIDTVAVTGIFQTIGVNMGANQTICPEEAVTLNAGSGGSTYSWSTGGSNQMETVMQEGTVSVTVSESGLCDGVDEIEIDWHDVDQAEISLSNDSCAERWISLDPNTHDVVIWSDSSTDTAMFATFPGYYFVTATDNNGCESVDSTWVTILDNPIVDLGADTFLCGNQTITLTTGVSGSHLWKDGSTGIVFTVTQKGKYSVSVTDDYGCTGADTIKISDCLGTDVTSQELLTLYPNPASDILFIDGANVNQAFTIFDANGRIVNFGSQVSNSINIESLESGMYFLQIQGQDETTSFLKE